MTLKYCNFVSVNIHGGTSFLTSGSPPFGVTACESEVELCAVRVVSQPSVILPNYTVFYLGPAFARSRVGSCILSLSLYDYDSAAAWVLILARSESEAAFGGRSATRLSNTVHDQCSNKQTALAIIFIGAEWFYIFFLIRSLARTPLATRIFLAWQMSSLMTRIWEACRRETALIKTRGDKRRPP